MKKYYMAYDKRYRQIHKKGMLWEVEQNTPVIIDIIKGYNITKDKEILDIGVGEGRDSIFLLKNGYKVTGIDCSPEAIKTCQELCNANGLNHNFKVVDVISSTPDKKYDFIYSVAVIHMLCDSKDRKNFYKYIKESLNNNGIALVMTMGDGNNKYTSDYDNAFCDTEREHYTGKVIKVAKTSCKIVTEKEFIEEITDSGLKLLEIFVTDNVPSFDKMMCAVISA